MNLLKRVLKWIAKVLDHIKAIELSLIAAALWWSFILAMPIETFSTSVAYKAMAGIASEEVWSGIFLTVALLNIYGLIVEKYLIRTISLVISSGLWVFVSAMFAMSSLATTGTGIYFIVACLNAFVVYKVGEQRGR
jgi:hypothetical protein